MTRNILVIENQVTQFRKISSALQTKGFNAYPDVEAFNEFLTWVRIVLNLRYSESRHEKVWKYIQKFFEGKAIDLLLVDYNLIGLGVGSAGNGLDFIQGIRTLPDFGDVPAVLLTRTEQHSEELQKPLSTIKDCAWVSKGHSGYQRFDISYFLEYGIPEIERLLPTKRLVYLNRVRDWLIRCGYPELNRIWNRWDVEKSDDPAQLDFADEVVRLSKEADDNGRELGDSMDESDLEALLERFSHVFSEK